MKPRSGQALCARQRKREGSRRATQPKLVGHGQKENREAVLMQTAAENPERGDDADHAPAVVKAGDALAEVENEGRQSGIEISSEGDC